MNKIKGLSRGEILVGMEKGVFKVGDMFRENSNHTMQIKQGVNNVYLKWINSSVDNVLELRVIDGETWDLIEEPNFKPGDWVVILGLSDITLGIGLFSQFDEHGNACLDDCYHKEFPQDTVRTHIWYMDDFNIRHATPEEIVAEKKRRWWSELGRQVDEYKIGDIVRCGPRTFTIEYFSEHKDLAMDQDDCCYLIERLILVCPVEVRLDVKG